MVVSGYLRAVECNVLHATLSSLRNAGTGMHGYPSPQIRQRESGYAVAAESGTQQREQRLVLRDRQLGAVTYRPVLGRPGKGKIFNFSNKWFSHYLHSSVFVL